MDAIKELTRDISRQIKNRIENEFMEIPCEACDCGKPVVFVRGARTFNCTRCGAQWKLTVTVERTKKGSE